MDMMALAEVLALVLALFVGAVSAATTVDTAWMKTTLRDHFSQARHHVTNPSYKAQAKDFILNEFKSYGLETYLNTFTSELPTVNGTNVIGIKKGKHFQTAEDKVIGVAAHYDTMRETPGVDDNGAGLVAMLQVAKHISKVPRNYTVVFVAFDFEEWEEADLPSVACSSVSCGSQEFLSNWVSTIWSELPTITGVIVMDTIMNIVETNDTQTVPAGFDQAFPSVMASINSDGKQGDFIAAIGRPYDSVLLDAFVNAYNALGQPEFEVEKIFIAQITGQRVTAAEYFIYGDLMRSDHYAFWKNGYPAIFLTDTANFRGYMSSCYHQACDMMSRVTDKMLQFGGKTTQAIIDTVNKLAPPDPKPKKPANGCSGVGGMSIFLLGIAMVILQRQLT